MEIYSRNYLYKTRTDVVLLQREEIKVPEPNIRHISIASSVMDYLTGVHELSKYKRKTISTEKVVNTQALAIDSLLLGEEGEDVVL